ncbi:MAG: hypothetical protein M3163_04230 [Actinomycetota bacterium]|nr:hypothetical protein [Actinomycetota bacterium]
MSEDSGCVQEPAGPVLQHRAAAHRAPGGAAGVKVVDSVSVGAVAPFNPDIEREGPAPAIVLMWRSQVAAAGGLLIASPE